jgi:hypothetical protein
MRESRKLNRRKLLLLGSAGTIIPVSSVMANFSFTPPPNARLLAAQIQQIYLGTLNVAQPISNRIFQRDSRTGGVNNLGSGTVLLTVTPSQPVTVLDYRLRDAASPATVLQDWTNGTPPLSAGQQQIGLTVPAGLKKYLIDLRANSDDTSVVSTTNPVMVGELVAFAGQSLAEIMLSLEPTGESTTIASLGLTISPWGWIFAGWANNNGAFPAVADGADRNYPPAVWGQPGDAVSPAFHSAFGVQFFNRMVALTQVPCGLIGYTVGGTGIDSWLPGYTGANPGHWTKLTTVLTAAGGKFGLFFWVQGHYETRNANTAPAYLTQLQTLFSAIIAAYPNGFKRVVATIPGVGAYGSGPTAIEMVRNTAKGFVSGDATAAYVDGLDTTLFTDLVHPSQAGTLIWADHFYRAGAGKLGLLTHGDQGPVVTGASRAYNSKWIYLAVNQTNGGTAWQTAGVPANQFQVFPAGATTGAIALDATTPLDLSDPSKIGLQLAAAPTEPQALDVWYRRPPDTATVISGAIYDNATDGDGITRGRQLWDPRSGYRCSGTADNLHGRHDI